MITSSLNTYFFENNSAVAGPIANSRARAIAAGRESFRTIVYVSNAEPTTLTAVGGGA